VQRCTKRNRPVDLEARPRKGDVLKIRDTAAGASALVSPLNVDQIRTQHSGFNAAIHHNLLVLSDTKRHSISTCAQKIALTRLKATPRCLVDWYHVWTGFGK